MATSLGSITWGSGPALPCSWSYDRRRSGADMQYRVYGTVNVGGTSRYFGYYIDAKVALGGSNKYTKRLKDSDPSQWSGELTFDTGWQTVSNKTSGSTSCVITLATNAPRGDGSWSYSLAVDAAASVIGTVSNFNFEDAFSVPITKYSNAFKDTLELILGGTTVKSITDYTSGTTIQLTDDELLSAYSLVGVSNKSATVTFKTTTKNGTSTVGMNTKTATGTIAGTTKVKESGSWKRAVPWVKIGGTWKRSIAKVRASNSWKRGL